jgi:hypothetical protein
MAALSLIPTGLAAGVWEGLISAPEGTTPELVASHLGTAIEGVALAPLSSGQWSVRVPVPAAAISDGVQTVVIADAASGEMLASFTLVAGEALAGDLRAEISLLRAELDILKRAFRRHVTDQD